MVRKEWSEQDLLIKAQNYCSLAEHCACEVREKLYQWGANPKVQDQILNTLMDLDFINESRYAEAFVHDKVELQGWGRDKIRMMLLMKHISPSVIDQSLGGIEEDVYEKQLERLIDQKRGVEPIKIARFLAQRGFTASEISAKIKF